LNRLRRLTVDRTQEIGFSGMRNDPRGETLDGDHGDGDHGQRETGRASHRTKAEAANPVQALSRALDLLESIAAAETGLGLGELGHATGLPPSTVHRLLKSLEQRHYVVHDEDSGRWFIGVQAFSVGGAFLRGRNYAALARPIMQRLMEQAGETVNLAAEDEGEAVFLAQVECRQMMRALSQPGTRVPLHCSGVGKALLAARTPEATAEALARVLGSGHPVSVTGKTITGRADLLRELAVSRERGYAIDDEEHAIGLRCVAAAIHDEHGRPLAALSISGPTARIPDERIPALGALVARAAAEVTAAVGGRLPDA
jgi:IclR family acetate operon transcriptional repressor